jgi:HK97 family phage major capsid protein
MEALGAKQVPMDQSARSGDVEMNEKEKKSYSLVRAINASITKDWSKAGFELEVSRELGARMGRETEGFFMPMNLQLDGERAAYAVGAAATGGNVVATNLLASSFIEVLRNRAQIMQLGPTILSGLVGNVAIPRQNSATQTYWVAEATAITEAEATFDQVTLSPKQIGARSQYSRLMLQQATPDIEALVRNDLAKVMALGIDLAAINGSGTSGQPKGILDQAGISNT